MNVLDLDKKMAQKVTPRHMQLALMGQSLGALAIGPSIVDVIRCKE